MSRHHLKADSGGNFNRNIMLVDSTLQRLIADAVINDLKDSEILRISTVGGVDSDGNEILRITVVLSDASAHALTGDQVIDLLLGVRTVLVATGEERFPIIEYATEADLLDDAA
jgi:hypothetical protein